MTDRFIFETMENRRKLHTLRSSPRMLDRFSLTIVVHCEALLIKYLFTFLFQTTQQQMILQRMDVSHQSFHLRQYNELAHGYGLQY